MSKTVFEWAKEFLEIGIAVFPVYFRNKTPKMSWEQYQQILPSETDIRRWFLGGSLHNYGVVAGWNDLVVLDFDSMDRFYEWVFWTLDADDQSPAHIAASLAFKVFTARGVHVYLQIPGVMQNSHIDGLDIKRHGYVIGPGSTHPTGKVYNAQDQALIIPRAPSLESVLPEDWVQQLQNPPEPHVCTEYVLDKVSDDPFEIASNPINSSQDLIKQIRERHKLQDYLKNVQHSRDNFFMALCPFHDDNTPSFWFDEKRQIGNCQKCNFPKPMDVINLYAKLHSTTDAMAIKVLSRQ